MIIYERLWECLKRKGISQNVLIRDYGVSTSQLYRLRKNQVVYTSTLDRLCEILECDLMDIVEYVPNEKQSQQKS